MCTRLSLGAPPPSPASYSSLLSVVLGKLKLVTPNHAQSEYVTEYLDDVDDGFSLNGQSIKQAPSRQSRCRTMT